ncbi:MAG: FeoA family protein [Clostridium sp.]
MEGILRKTFFGRLKGISSENMVSDSLCTGKEGTVYRIVNINTNDEELKNFLFTLGCYEGEEITLISILGDNYIVSIKDGRYSIDRELAKEIKVEEV